MQYNLFESINRTNPLGINDCIIEVVEAFGRENNTNLHWHHAFELTLVLEGCIHYFAEGKEHYVSAGNFLFINSGTIHLTKNASDTEKVRALLMIIPDSIIQKLEPSVTQPYFHIKKNTPEQKLIIKSLYRLVDALERPEPYMNLFIKSELLNILYLLFSKCYNPERMRSLYNGNALIKHIIRYVWEHHSEEISIKIISSIAGLQENYFCRYFKKETGVSFHQYLSRIRLDAALSLLITGKYSVLDCALEAGFSSDKVMIEWCKKIYLCTPLQYKSRYINKS